MWFNARNSEDSVVFGAQEWFLPSNRIADNLISAGMVYRQTGCNSPDYPATWEQSCLLSLRQQYQCFHPNGGAV
jgi:hypothetical protein